MLGKVLNHFVAPRVTLAAAKLSAALQGQAAFRVLGQNMEPTFPQGTICRYRRMGPAEQVIRGSVVAFTCPEFAGHVVPSRVLAVGGDTVQIEDGQLFVNGQKLAEPYVKGTTSSEYTTESQVVPEGTYFLLGDYRDASKDSRHLGPVSRASILGLVRAPSEA